eukprot:scaffold5997_cov133-Cylindrotheca_fusiformis.AAC.3
MNQLEERRERIDSLDFDVEKVLFNDSPETLYFHSILEEKTQMKEQMEVSSPRRLFYNMDLPPCGSPKASSPSSACAGTPKKQLNWRRPSSPRKRRQRSPDLAYRKKTDNRCFRLIFVFTTLAAIFFIVGIKIDDNTRGKFVAQATEVYRAASSQLNTLISTTTKAEMDHVSETPPTIVTEPLPECSRLLKKIFNKECRKHARKLRLESKRLRAKRQ